MIEHVWLERGIVRWHIGAVSAQDYLLSDAQLRQDGRFDEVHYLIDDFLDCSALIDSELVSSDPVRTIDWAIRHVDFRHAIVSSNAALRERAYRLAIKSMGSPSVSKFSEMGKAREWVKGDKLGTSNALRQWGSAGGASLQAGFARAG